MAERPILFSGPMVRAILDGRKTQTRRVLKPQPDSLARVDHIEHVVGTRSFDLHTGARFANGRFEGSERMQMVATPYAPGDRLWVREAWRTIPLFDADRPSDLSQEMPIQYIADGGVQWSARYRPSIHMPRWASRITLEVTEVRVQRLQDISEQDAIAEGLLWSEPTDEDREWAREYAVENGGSPEISGVWLAPGTRQGWGLTKENRDRPEWGPNAVFAYRCLWNSINGPGSWDENPWVAAYTFKRIAQKGAA